MNRQTRSGHKMTWTESVGVSLGFEKNLRDGKGIFYIDSMVVR